MTITLPFLALYASLSVYLVIYDLRTGLLPDRVTCPLLWGGLLFHLCAFPSHITDALWGAIAGYAGLACIYWCYRFLYQKEGLGYGDVKFLAALGAWHGWMALPFLLFWSTLLAFIYVAVMTVAHGRSVLKNPLPFGPFLAAAGFVTGFHSLTSGAINLSL